MNTTRKHTLAAITAAAFMTLAMLVGVNTIATSDAPPAAQIALASSTHA